MAAGLPRLWSFQTGAMSTSSDCAVPILLRVHHQARLFQSLRPELRWQTHAPVGDQRDPVELEPDLATLGLDVIDRFFRVGPRLEAEVYVRRDLPAVATPLLVLAVGAHTANLG